MRPIPCLDYPESEKPVLEKLHRLFIRWHQHFGKSIAQIQSHGAFFHHDHMVCDGFFPCYFRQRPRVLFVGRESIGMSGQNYIESMHHAYSKARCLGRIGGGKPTPLNRARFHARLLKLAYAFANGLPDWHLIPPATQIGGTLGAEGGVSYAFMNLSKFSTEREDWRVNWPLIMASNQISERERFCEKQVCILQPDLIITMNLGHHLSLLGKIEKVFASGGHQLCRMQSEDHASWVIDTFHFSAWQKQDVRDIYLPICSLIREHLPSIVSKAFASG